jgi:hypothetical protein
MGGASLCLRFTRLRLSTTVRVDCCRRSRMARTARIRSFLMAEITADDAPLCRAAAILVL